MLDGGDGDVGAAQTRHARLAADIKVEKYCDHCLDDTSVLLTVETCTEWVPRLGVRHRLGRSTSFSAARALDGRMSFQPEV